MWKKEVNYKKEKAGYDDYEYVNQDGISIRITHNKKQGFPGSNSVVVLGGKEYGGWLLGTPKMFKTESQARNFAKKSMLKINKKQYGKKVPFPD